MKHLYILFIIAVGIVGGLRLEISTASARTPLEIDANADIRAEFADDLPKTYSEAIGEVRGGSVGKTSGNQSATTEVNMNTSSQNQITFTDTTPEYVRVVYTGNAKLFGFLPVPVAVEVAAYADGSVRVALPWYRFLLTHDDIPTIENNLEAKIQTTTTLPSPSGTISIETQQTVLSLFTAELSNYFK